MTLTFLEDFETIMDRVEADVELAILREKFGKLQQQRTEATKRYITKMRETNPEFRDKERARAKKSYELHREEILGRRKQRGNRSEIDRVYYEKLKERMNNDPEFKQQRLDQQRARAQIRKGLLEAKTIVDNVNIKQDTV